MTQVNSGWYPDPSGDPSKLRYWNGFGWSDDLIDTEPAQTPEQVYGAPCTAQAQQFAPQAQQFAPQTQQFASPAAKNPGKGLGIASLIFGIISILSVVDIGYSVAGCCSHIPSLVYTLGALLRGVLGLMFGIIGRKKSRAVGMSHDLATAGIVTSIIGTSILLLMVIGVALYYFVP